MRPNPRLPSASVPEIHVYFEGFCDALQGGSAIGNHDSTSSGHGMFLLVYDDHLSVIHSLTTSKGSNKYSIVESEFPASNSDSDEPGPPDTDNSDSDEKDELEDDENLE